MDAIDQQMRRAAELIRARRYTEARQLLQTINHPKAREWLARLNQIAPPPAPPPGQAPAWLAGLNQPVPPPSRTQGRSDTLLYMVLLGVVAVLVIVIGLLLAGSSGSQEGAAIAAPTLPNSAEAILGTIYTNIDAANSEDIPLYMLTIHPQSPSYAQTEAGLRQIVGLYDIAYEVSGLQVLSHSGSEARVAFVLTTRKISGPEFQDNEITGTFIMRLDGDYWKIYNQQIDNIRYLN